MLSARKINKFTLQVIFKSKKSFYLSFNDETALAEYKYGFTEITQLEFDTLKAMIEDSKSEEALEIDKNEIKESVQIFANKIQLRKRVV